MYEIKCTGEQWSTIKTALRLEIERNYGKSPEVVDMLESALSAVMAALGNSSRRV